MSSIGTRIKSSREAKGLLQSQLAEMIGVKSANVISNWEKDVSKPDANKMVKLCQVLNISLSYLLDYYGEKNAPSISDEAAKLAEDYDKLDNHGQRVVRIVTDEEKARMAVELQKQHSQDYSNRKKMYFSVPEYISPMSAGTGTEANQEYPENLKLIKEPPRGTSYIAHVSGNSMEPTYSDGDKLFIHACTKINAGQIGVFFMEGQQWVKELDNGVLISHNPEYEPIPLREDIRCQGLVLGICDESYFE